MVILSSASLEGKKKDKKEDQQPKDEKKGADNLPSAEELQKMTPSDFAKWVLARIDEGVKTLFPAKKKLEARSDKKLLKLTKQLQKVPS